MRERFSPVGEESKRIQGHKIHPSPVGILTVYRQRCALSAHTFAAGYEITTEDGLARTIEAVENTVGLGRVYVLHVNDSKTPLGSRVDRHQNIGRGEIGRKAFGRILNHPRLMAGGPGCWVEIESAREGNVRPG